MTKSKSNDIYPVSTFIEDLSINLTSAPSPNVPPNTITARRLVIIGDVHGSRKTLEKLLQTVQFDKEKGDLLIFVGDLVNKGPDSGGVIDLALRLSARSVRGNHDDAVLRAAERLKQPGDSATEQTEKKSRSTITAEGLSPEQIDYLAGLPMILRIRLMAPVLDVCTIVVVHAGIVPGVPLEEQDAHAVMHMRSLGRGEDVKLVPMEEAGERGWVEDWDEWQGREEGTVVVFGHDARRRLQRGRFALGLESGCVYGGMLSAWVVGEGGMDVVQVECVDEVVESE